MGVPYTGDYHPRHGADVAARLPNDAMSMRRKCEYTQGSVPGPLLTTKIAYSYDSDDALCLVNVQVLNTIPISIQICEDAVRILRQYLLWEDRTQLQSDANFLQRASLDA